jgi:hypothetical protein
MKHLTHYDYCRVSGGPPVVMVWQRESDQAGALAAAVGKRFSVSWCDGSMAIRRLFSIVFHPNANDVTTFPLNSF